MSQESKPSPKRAPQQRCPICSKPVPPDHPSYPFCSERCRKIDLGRWAQEKYRTTRPIEQSDLDEE